MSELRGGDGMNELKFHSYTIPFIYQLNDPIMDPWHGLVACENLLYNGV